MSYQRPDECPIAISRVDLPGGQGALLSGPYLIDGRPGLRVQFTRYLALPGSGPAVKYGLPDWVPAPHRAICATGAAGVFRGAIRIGTAAVSLKDEVLTVSLDVVDTQPGDRIDDVTMWMPQKADA